VPGAHDDAQSVSPSDESYGSKTAPSQSSFPLLPPGYLSADHDSDVAAHPKKGTHSLALIRTVHLDRNPLRSLQPSFSLSHSLMFACSLVNRYRRNSLWTSFLSRIRTSRKRINESGISAFGILRAAYVVMLSVLCGSSSRPVKSFHGPSADVVRSNVQTYSWSL
jgi:hypothetical protein